MRQVGLEDYIRHEHLPAYNEIVQEFYAHLELTMGDQPVHTIVRGRMFPFMRHEIINTIPIPDVAEEEPSFSDRVNDTLSRFPTFRESYMNLNDYAFTTTFMRSELLKELVLVSHFTKFNIALSSTTT